MKMSTYLPKLNLILTNMESTKIIVRKSTVVDLLNLLDIKEAVAEINNNSNELGFNPWMKMLYNVHKLLILETERLAMKDDGRLTNEKLNMNRLLINIARLANNHPKPRLKLDSLIPLVLQIFGSKLYNQHHSTYLDILVLKVLPNPLNHLKISCEMWNELLENCIKIYNSPNVQKIHVFNAIQMIIHYGCSGSDLALHVKKILPFIEKIVSTDEMNQELFAKSAFKLTLTVCQQIAIDNRHSLCEFSENILRYITSLNGSVEKYNLLLFIMKIHHPKGRDKKENAAYAFNWENWKTVLQSFYTIIMNDCSMEVLPTSFISFASAVFKQILGDADFFDDTKNLNELSYRTLAKRRRTGINIRNLIDLISNADPRNTLAIIQIVKSIIEHYPQCLQPHEFPTLLKEVVDKLTLSQKQEKLIGHLYELIIVLIRFEKSFCDTNQIIEDSKVYWDKIWDICLRSLSVNQNQASSHKLVQYMMLYDKNISSKGLLRLYITNTIIWSQHSLSTLSLFCEYVFLPDDTANLSTTLSPMSDYDSVKLSLLKWVLNISWYEILRSTLITIENVCTFLISFVLKSSWYSNWIKKTRFETLPQFVSYESSEQNDTIHSRLMETCYLALSYEFDLLPELNKEPVRSDQESSNKVLYSDEILHTLINSLSNMTESKEDICDLIMKTTIISKVLSLLISMNIVSETTKGLMKTIESNMKAIGELMVGIDVSKNLPINLLNITRALTFLYETSYDKEISIIIVSSTSKEMLKSTFFFMNVDELNAHAKRNSVHYMDPNDFSKKDLMEQGIDKDTGMVDIDFLKIQVMRCLVLFYNIETKIEKFDIQNNTINYLLNNQPYDLDLSIDFQILLTMVELLIKYEKFNTDPMKYLTKLANNIKISEHVAQILNILLKYLNVVQEYSGILINILNIFRKNLNKRRFGPLIQIKYIKLITKMSQIKWSYRWPMPDNSLIMEDVIIYVNSPFYHVRLEAVRSLRDIFSVPHIDYNMKSQLYKKFLKQLDDSFVIGRDLDEGEKINEKLTRTSSGLLGLAVVMCNIGTLQSDALFKMLTLKIDKNIDDKTIDRVLKLTSNQINCNNIFQRNLDILLLQWKKLHPELYTFPWALSKCKTEKEFIETNIDAIAFQKIQDLNIQTVQNLCSNINVPFDQVLLRILPKLFSHLSCTINASTKIQFGVEEFYGRLINNMGEFRSIKKFVIHLNEKLDEFVFNLIQRIHDEQDFFNMFERKVALPLSDPPHFDKKIVNASINFLKEFLSTSNESLQWILVTEHPSALPKILLNLTDRIYNSKFTEHKLKAFHHYVCFCEFILEEIQTAHYNSISMYLVREISYTLLHLIKEENTILSEISCEYLYKFFQTILPGKSAQVEDILRFCTITLNPLIKTIPAAKKVLKFLIVDQVDALRGAIGKLDPFPDDSELTEVRTMYTRLRYKTEEKPNLENEIKHFLNSTKGNDINNISVEGLANMKDFLSLQKEALENMYHKLEECNPSFLHRLVYKLMKLTTSNNNKVAIEAIKCLGELGPANLTTMIVQVDKIHINETSHYVEILTYRALTLLTKLLIDSDIECRKASAEALYAVFKSNYGQAMLVGKKLTKIGTIIDDENVILRTEYIWPFIVKFNCSSDDISVDHNEFKLSFDSCINVLTRNSNDSYFKWIVDVTCTIINCFSGCYFNKLLSICRLSSEFCELILPRMMFLMILKDKHLSLTLYRCINHFFEHHFSSSNEINDTKSQYCDHKIVDCMLDVVNFIRIQTGDNHRVKLNYLCIAKAAQYCSAHFTALLYAELSCEMLGTSYDTLNNIPKVDYIYEIEPVQGRIIQNILRDAYLEIDDLDGIYACGSSHFHEPTARVQHYIHTRQWDKVILAQDIELCSGNDSAMRDMVRALQQSGLQYLLGHFISTVNENIDKIDDFQYESSWRLCDWDINVNKNTINSQCFTARKYETNYYSSHYRALKFLHEGDDIGVNNEIQSSRMDIIKTFRGISLESSKTIYEHLGYLQMLREIEELCTARVDEYDEIIRKWRSGDTIDSNEFYYIEPILTQRTVMYQINETLRGHESIKRALAETYLKIGQVAENQGHLQIAARVLGTLAKQLNLDEDIQDQLHYQESVLAWTRNDHEIGRSILRNLLRKPSLNPNLKVQVLRVYGDWMAETKSENPQTIIEQYYLKSITSGGKLKNQSSEMAKHIHHAQVSLAKFVDAQFEQISAYVKSPQFEGLKECIEFARGSAKNVPAVQSQDLKRAVIFSQRQSKNDAAEIANIEKEKDNYLQLAIEYYAKTLCNSDSYNLLIFRLIALWLDNKHNDDVDRLMNRYLNAIPSYKFIPIVPQLAAHMRNPLDRFSTKIHSILERCAKHHPHHTLPVLLALKNLHGDHEYTSTTSTKKEPRVLGAQELIKKLNSDHNIGVILQQMDQLSQALVMLANYKCEEKNSNTINVPKNQKILKIKDFSNALLSTLTINVNPNGSYNNIVGISKYQSRFEMVGGINVPKKVTCVGTDGISRNQLLKGTDDLRQDAVMQQVFTVMNTLLNTCKETKRRKLKIRTYKVMPLTQRSGILEWCDNTIPLGIALVGPDRASGIHKKSYPNDWTAMTCRKKMQEVQHGSLEEKLKTFKECCKNLRPAFHHYFMDKYPSPEIWFERRLTYTRSVATTSIAGYILGLGDRHLRNILFDESTAEVIHIDLGIAFEQGKVLLLPETVPFRLTRDIEVAMGVSGVEGPMRRSCQEILSVLRDQRHIIITLLQALRYDPLFTWAITPEKACNVQGGNIGNSNKGDAGKSETNKTAERAILRIEQKLQGTEEGLASSVSGQIERLIQQARDPLNLCRIYCGWEPYL